MIQKSSGSGRRFLTNPAIYPCGSISPLTLLNSLIDLGGDICNYKSKFFSVNKRNARETFRQISNLLLFLQEIRDTESDLPDPIILSLSELHLSLQKIMYLLEDCTRDGTRAWMLMNSDRFAEQFRIVIRGLATGLDVFPLSTIELSNEAKDLVELIVRQARKAAFEPDPEDKEAMKDLMRILNHFEEGNAPDPNEIRRILDHLGIHKWSSCNKEVKFLYSEIGTEFCNGEKRTELELLSSLMGFMSYCRCVILDTIDFEGQHRNGQYNKSSSSEGFKGINVDDLKCPISLEVMSDPVTLSSGHTYDRCSILKWFRSGNATCPKTGEKLITTELVPNLVLKGMIQQYCAENGLPVVVSRGKNWDISRTAMAGSLAEEGAVKILAGFLINKIVNGSNEEMNKAAFEIRVLTKRSIFNRSCLIESGTVPLLLKLLLSEDSNIQENSIAALLNLSKHSKGKGDIVENEGLDLIVHVLRKGLKIEAQQHAAATLYYLASVEENRALIGENPEAIPGLVDLVKNENHCCKRNALVVISRLLVHPGNHWRVLASGVVPLLLNLLRDSEREDLFTESLAVLATLAEKIDGTVAILRRGGLKLLVEILNTSTSKTAKEHCVSMLLALCINGGLDVVARLVKNPSLMRSLYSQLSEGTSRASKKAGAIIKILHQFYENNSPSTSATPVLPQERFVHVW
ncbi:equilibrative nucleotide transporter 1-like [Hibiscus syriacus]|uniref:RING-type E3 ubiquitin transferase n=1 Tax=Hibiscus syriacus TaxID=106335 RepID=A0A6A3CSP2_HIBSY|nr:U-box domain-containing protein 19-like [Hibiscus syriacus]KAE8730229.1 equilibrative nucleotide transporter 1-like [Hibiscus syriacus]